MSRPSPQILMVDNYDSFTFTLVDYLLTAGARVTTVRNDELTAGEASCTGAAGFVISPGPGDPTNAGISVALAAACIARRRPLLGVCLGHQAIALAASGAVGRTAPVHGKAGPIYHDGTGLLAGLPSPFAATRYHSLGVLDAPLALAVNAWSKDGLVMGLRHREAPVHGVQFHPESIASEHGRALIASFVELCQVDRDSNP